MYESMSCTTALRFYGWPAPIRYYERVSARKTRGGGVTFIAIGHGGDDLVPYNPRINLCFVIFVNCALIAIVGYCAERFVRRHRKRPTKDTL
jgi:hypothetical protein